MKRLHTFLSSLGKFFKQPRKKKAAKPGVHSSKPAKPAPAAPVDTMDSAPQPIPTPPPVKVEEKKTPKPPKRKLDKKGFRILTDKDDLLGIFEAENDFTKQAEQHESFDRLFEKSQSDIYQQRLLKEKVYEEYKKNHTRPLTPGERLQEYPPPQAELDLHGCTAAEAEKKAEIFVGNARRRGIRTLRVIVGKGLHSNGKAVLPDLIQTKMIQLKRRQWILSFKWENKDKRKSGALIVYLK